MACSQNLSPFADDPANNKLLMVLEYVEGGSLFAGTKISPKKRLTELSARKYFRDVLQVKAPAFLLSALRMELLLMISLFPTQQSTHDKMSLCTTVCVLIR